MSTVAIAFGVLLSILGGGVYSYLHFEQPTSLIPAAFGVVLILCGFVARNDKARKHAMHFAAMLGLIGCVMPLFMVIKAVAVDGKPFENVKHGEQLAMAVLCGVFLALCVKSFIDVRKARKAAEAGK